MSATTPVSSRPASSMRETPLCRRSAARVSEQRVGLRQLAVAIGPEDEHPHGLLGRRQVTKQQQASLVGPLEVVEDEHDGLVFATPWPASPTTAAKSR